MLLCKKNGTQIAIESVKTGKKKVHLQKLSRFISDIFES